MSDTSCPFPMDNLDTLEVKVLGVNVLPAMVKVMGLLPDSTRRNFNTKQNAPTKDSIPYDKYDCLGENPYQTLEVKEGKVWRVTYTVEDTSLTNTKGKKEAKGFGMDWTDRKVKEKVLAGAASEGGRAVEVVEADLARMEVWWNKTEWTMEERFSVPPGKLNSMVVKLSSGSVLLYAPVRVRDEVGFGAWLESLGRVEWIVVASSFHTLFLASVLARFPEAKVVGAPQAQDKLVHVGGLPRGKFDYISTSKEDLARLNKELEGEGVQVYSVEGEIMCDSLMVVAHGIMLTCDLTYGRHDGGIFFFSREELDLYREEHTSLRLFKYLICNKPHSPNGVLAKYRFWALDHTTSGTGPMLYTPPSTDGSNPALLAASLRTNLRLAFDSAMGVHFDHMEREQFRQTINLNWSWLDGRSLI